MTLGNYPPTRNQDIAAAAAAAAVPASAAAAAAAAAAACRYSSVVVTLWVVTGAKRQILIRNSFQAAYFGMGIVGH